MGGINIAKKKAGAYQKKVGSYMKQGYSMKEAHRLAKGGKPRGEGKKTPAKGKKKGGGSVKKAFKTAAHSFYQRPFTMIDNIVAFSPQIGPLKRIADEFAISPDRGFRQILRQYCGLALNTDNTIAEWRPEYAVGAIGLLEGVLYKTEMKYINKMAPVKGLIPKSIGEARNLAINALARFGVYDAAKFAYVAPTGLKAIRYTSRFSQNFVGQPYDDTLIPGKWDWNNMVRGQLPIGIAIGTYKLSTMVTKHIKGGFKMPRF